MNERLPLCTSAGRTRDWREERKPEVSTPAVLALEDGTVFRGVSVGAKGNTTGEVVFNTAMTGYQEILTDPSYCRQIVTLTYPHIGNTGTTPEDLESGAVFAAGSGDPGLAAVALELARDRVLEQLPAPLQGGRHRRYRHAQAHAPVARERCAQSGCIMTGDSIDETAAVRAAKKFLGLKGMDLAKAVSTKKSLPMERWSDLEVDREAAPSTEPAACGCVRLRHQTQHPEDSGRAWLPHDGGSCTNASGSSTCDES